MTAQVCETLVLHGQRMDMSSCPPIPDAHPQIRYLSDEEIHNEHGGGLTQSTACWRGYVGTWEIRYGRLYLSALRGRVGFKGLQPLLADWVTGTLSIPEGQDLDDGCFGFPLREHLRMIDVEKGTIVSERVVETRALLLQAQAAPWWEE